MSEGPIGHHRGGEARSARRIPPHAQRRQLERPCREGRSVGRDAPGSLPIPHGVRCTGTVISVKSISGRTGIDLKFARAFALIDQLETEVIGYLGGQPFRLEEAEGEDGMIHSLVRIDRYPPDEWSLLVGDIVHNARSALDHLAWRLVESCGATPTEHTSFPITDAPDSYSNRLRADLKGTTPEVRAAVKGLAPWKTGDRKLWQLHKLNIIDKHRLLIPVGASNPSVGLQAGMNFDGEYIETPMVYYGSDGRQFPLKDGDVVLRTGKGAGTQDFEMTLRHEIRFDVAFGDRDVVDGQPLVATLRDLVIHASQVVEPLITRVTDPFAPRTSTPLA